jgi:hypothetical protein
VKEKEGYSKQQRERERERVHREIEVYRSTYFFKTSWKAGTQRYKRRSIAVISGYGSCHAKPSWKRAFW